mmetsp:Transcript_14563/g.20993  ORF Transcript_14563/g.20993 Transcript_14563/m.20993 type:complete len:105 (+) Transcript_14563:627-941(+)
MGSHLVLITWLQYLSKKAKFFENYFLLFKRIFNKVLDLLLKHLHSSIQIDYFILTLMDIWKISFTYILAKIASKVQGALAFNVELYSVKTWPNVSKTRMYGYSV